ncbi:26S proteasome regulatory subunit 8-like [Teleopsis dalmanni]|uniref:26S proteasome regulatory subunit 8-like n=1 Tax=Teleopsis dalmanni TaxID=139649 RepID=UPI0018CF0F7F|nr:26S proteasome regulatory subunit 8-like [Teleopsis dalmanni]
MLKGTTPAISPPMDKAPKVVQGEETIQSSSAPATSSMDSCPTVTISEKEELDTRPSTSKAVSTANGHAVQIPTLGKTRLDILKIHSRKINLTRCINLRKASELISGTSGAEVKSVCIEAGMYALCKRCAHVTQEDFEMTVAKVMQKDSDKNMSIKKLWK